MKQGHSGPGHWVALFGPGCRNFDPKIVFDAKRAANGVDGSGMPICGLTRTEKVRTTIPNQHPRLLSGACSFTAHASNFVVVSKPGRELRAVVAGLQRFGRVMISLALPSSFAVVFLRATPASASAHSWSARSGISLTRDGNESLPLLPRGDRSGRSLRIVSRSPHNEEDFS
jgi:hypothetical protein